MPTTDFSAEAYAAVDRAAGSRRSLCVPTVLEEAAALLTDLWAAGQRHEVAPGDWAGTVDLAGAALDIMVRQYDRAPRPQRTAREVVALSRHLVEALTAAGLTARLAPHTYVIVECGPRTPRSGFRRSADFTLGIYTDAGWDLALNAHGDAVLSIAAPATPAGAAEVAEVVRALVQGELGNPFRR